MSLSGGVSLCWVLNLYHPFLNQEANTTGVLLTIESPVECIVTLTCLPPFPSPIQALSVVILPASAMLIVCQ